MPGRIPPKRPSNTVSVIERELSRCEQDEGDALSPLMLWDELSRLERKWVKQIEEKSERRRPGDPAKLDRWFDRLRHITERSLRIHGEHPAIRNILEKLLQRRKLSSTPT